MEPAEGKAAEAEEMPPKAGGCQQAAPWVRHGHERIGRKDYGPAALVLRSIKVAQGAYEPFAQVPLPR